MPPDDSGIVGGPHGAMERLVHDDDGKKVDEVEEHVPPLRWGSRVTRPLNPPVKDDQCAYLTYIASMGPSHKK